MRIVKLSAAILAALFLSATATAVTITQEGSGIAKDGEIKVKVVFEDGKIKNVDVLKQQENPVLSQKVFTDLKDEIVKTDSTYLDVIAGATYSSLALLTNCLNHLQKRIFRRNHHESVSRISFDFSFNPDEKTAAFQFR